MCLVGKNGVQQFIPSIARQVYDVSGAGDTVVATLAAGIAAGLDFPDAARLANIAAGVVVGKIGTQPIHLLELKAAVGVKDDNGSGIVNHKLHSPASAAVQVQAWKAANQKVVFHQRLLRPAPPWSYSPAKRVQKMWRSADRRIEFRRFGSAAQRDELDRYYPRAIALRSLAPWTVWILSSSSKKTRHLG